MSSEAGQPGVQGTKTAPLLIARRDAVMLAILIIAVVLLIWNGSAFFRQISAVGADLGREARTASIALTLNVALILFGWRQ